MWRVVSAACSANAHSVVLIHAVPFVGLHRDGEVFTDPALLIGVAHLENAE